ncbi:MAG: response regulator [Chloroflexi bacterium]|nr:response regulator [Chloroflexota bacterium]
MYIVVAGKQRALRNALKGFLQTRPGYEVVGTAADKEELLIQVETKSPDLLLLDEDLTVLLIEEVIVPLQRFDPCPKIVVLGGRPESRKKYLDAGVATLVGKAGPPKSLLTAIEEIRLQRNNV